MPEIFLCANKQSWRRHPAWSCRSRDRCRVRIACALARARPGSGTASRITCPFAGGSVCEEETSRSSGGRLPLGATCDTIKDVLAKLSAVLQDSGWIYSSSRLRWETTYQVPAPPFCHARLSPLTAREARSADGCQWLLKGQEALDVLRLVRGGGGGASSKKIHRKKKQRNPGVLFQSFPLIRGCGEN